MLVALLNEEDPNIGSLPLFLSSGAPATDPPAGGIVCERFGRQYLRDRYWSITTYVGSID
jgi:hypothetical protein